MATRTAISAGAVILREIEGKLKIALAQHANTTNSWVLPKGHVEAGETIEQTALREIYEETGLENVQLITHLGTILRERLKSNGDVEEKTIHLFLAYAPGNSHSQAPSDPRFVEVSWFSPQEALKLLPYESERAFFWEHLGTLIE
jgi:8-oxo-dGTP pyrophosphatase MutT (NUDIX family)